MISERQQEADCRNAPKSHGPITPEGRAAVRHNALKHGFTTEEILVEDIVIARWRLNRIPKMEPGYFALRREVLKDLVRRRFNWRNDRFSGTMR